MGYRDPYDFDDDYETRRRRRDAQDEGPIGRARDWFREKVNDISRGRNRERNRDYERNYERNRQRDIYLSSYSPDYDRDFERETPYEAGYERRSPDQYRGNRMTGYGTRYGRDYSSDWDARQDYGSWDRPGYRRGQDRDYDQDYEYGLGRYEPYNRERRPEYNRYTRRDYNRETNRGAYPAAGMGADYGQRYDYEERDYYDEGLNYGEGDVGYDSEGAFYQDLDEPENFANQDYGSGWGYGQFRGMGPEGYTRSDERITEDVCERLTRNGRVDASDIAIDVHNGEVTLSGTVPGRDMKRRAEDVVENVLGVRDVHNEIKVNPRRERGWETRAESSMAGQTNAGAGVTSAGATSWQGMQEADRANENRSKLRENMHVIDPDGQTVGKVKEIRQDDFLVDRNLAPDVYVPFSAIESVSDQVKLTIKNDDIDKQEWEKPSAF